MTNTLIKIFVGLAVLFFLSACQSDTCYIQGEAPQMVDGSVLLLTDGEDNDKTIDTLIVKDKHFHYLCHIETPKLCRLRPASSLNSGLYFFSEPGHIYIELSPREQCSRVSGTTINNHWQALNDNVAKYDLRLRQLIGSANDSVQTRRISLHASHLYRKLILQIKTTALQNKDNVLGRFIESHFTNY